MKLQVGDILLDSDNAIAYGADSATAGDNEEAVGLFQHVAHAPRWAHALVGSGAAVFSLTLLAGAILVPFGVLVLPAAVFGRLGAYALLLALAPRRTRARTLSSKEAQRLMQAIEGEGAVGVERLMTLTGWTEQRVVEGLTVLMARRDVDEDLDIETGRWLYHPTQSLADFDRRNTLSAHDRLKSIEHTLGVHHEN